MIIIITIIIVIWMIIVATFTYRNIIFMLSVCIILKYLLYMEHFCKNKNLLNFSSLCQ